MNLNVSFNDLRCVPEANHPPFSNLASWAQASPPSSQGVLILRAALTLLPDLPLVTDLSPMQAM